MIIRENIENICEKKHYIFIGPNGKKHCTTTESNKGKEHNQTGWKHLKKLVVLICK